MMAKRVVNFWRSCATAGFLSFTCHTAAAQTTAAPAMQSNEQAQTAAVDSLASWTAIFQNAAEQWTTSNVTGDPWNESGSATPYSFGTYPPILLYAGPSNALCGAPSSTAESVNLVSAGYLPANFGAAYSGEYCAMVYPDSGTAASSGPVGAQGGNNLVPATTVLSYFVAGTAVDRENLLGSSPQQYVVSHLANLMAQNFAAGGSAMKYAPIINNSGETSSTWTSVQP